MKRYRLLDVLYTAILLTTVLVTFLCRTPFRLEFKEQISIFLFGADRISWYSSNPSVIASNRDDLVYGRPYIAYIGPDGTIGKPFLLPQKDPDKYTTMLKSFNLPELYAIPEVYNAARRSANFYNDVQAVQVQYKP